MNCVLKYFDVVKDGKQLAHFELFRRGTVNEVRTSTEVIFTGAFADQKYMESLNTNKMMAQLMDAQVIEG